MSKSSKQRGGVPKIDKDSPLSLFRENLNSNNIGYVAVYSSLIQDVEPLETALMHTCLSYDDKETLQVREIIQNRINKLSTK